MHTAPAWLDGLNPAQLQAVMHEGSRLLILAGAGSGKTRVITTKIAWLVRERGIEPESILAVTFTNKAAREMRDRACAIEPECSRSVLRTFHSFGAWFLRRNAREAGLDPSFVIYDDDDASNLLQKTVSGFTKRECSSMYHAISRAKDYGLDCDAPNLAMVSEDTDFRRIYTAYEQGLRRTGNVDFGDLIRLPAKLLEKDEAIRRRTHQRFRVILVDEYQDSNVAQFQLLQRLAGDSAYLCVVGDDDQSIYHFRGAEIRNILDFPKIFEGTDIIKLERNYRSYQKILDIAAEVVSHNGGRLGKTLIAERSGGSKPSLVLLEDQDAEVEFCIKMIHAHMAKGARYSDIAILYRTNAQSLGFEKAFTEARIPYHLVGALRFYDREEVKDVLAWLAFTANPRDPVAFSRILNKPTRGLGQVAEASILDLASRKGIDLFAACQSIRSGLKGKAKAGIDEFIHLATVFRSLLGRTDARLEGQAGIGTPGIHAVGDEATPAVFSATEGVDTTVRVVPEQQSGTTSGAGGKADKADTASLALLVEMVATRSGLAEYHRSQDEIAGTQKLANLDELINAASLYPCTTVGLTEYLETVELDRSLSQNDEAIDAVTLITMHNTKGLEFPIVIATGLEQGLFPRDEDQDEELEEQRRLFYVAITRAKDSLYLCACRWRRLHGRLFESAPSRFLTEIDPQRIDIIQGSGSAPATLHTPASSRILPFTGGGGWTQNAARPKPARKEPDAQDETSRWQPGTQVYHDEYGSGFVIKVSPTPSSGPLVVVRFETGMQAQFFPRLTQRLQIERSQE